MPPITALMPKPVTTKGIITGAVRIVAATVADDDAIAAHVITPLRIVPIVPVETNTIPPSTID